MDCPHHEAIVVRVTSLEEKMEKTSEVQESILGELRGIKGFIAQGRTALYVLVAFIVASQMGVTAAIEKFLVPLIKP